MLSPSRVLAKRKREEEPQECEVLFQDGTTCTVDISDCGVSELKRRISRASGKIVSAVFSGDEESLEDGKRVSDYGVTRGDQLIAMEGQGGEAKISTEYGPYCSVEQFEEFCRVRGPTISKLDMSRLVCIRDFRALDQLPHLRELSLQDIRILPDKVPQLEGVCKHLLTLSLVSNPIGVEGAIHLAWLLSSGFCSVTDLNLKSTKLYSEGISLIAESLETNHVLTELNISSCQLGYAAGSFTPKPQGAIDFGAALAKNTTLRCLNAGSNGLVQEAAIALLNDRMCLNTLVILGNELGVDGTAALANLIEKNATLTELDASQCSLLAEGAQLLATALQANASLRTLSLSGNVQLQQKYCALILQALESEDSAVSSLNLRNCGICFQHSPCKLLTADDGKRLTVATCDGPCGKTILSGCVCHGCSSCDFDLCTACFDDLCPLAMVAKAVKNCAQLTELNLQGNPLVKGEDNTAGKVVHAKGLQLLQEALANSTTMVKFTFCTRALAVQELRTAGKVDLGPVVVSALDDPLAASIIEQNRLLEELSFGGIKLSTKAGAFDLHDKGLASSGVLLLTSILPQCTALATVDVSNNNLKASSLPGQLAAVLLALCTARTITSLHLGNNGLSHVDMVVVLDAVEKVKKVKTMETLCNVPILMMRGMKQLGLEDANIGFEGACVLERYLPRARSVRAVSFRVDGSPPIFIWFGTTEFSPGGDCNCGGTHKMGPTGALILAAMLPRMKKLRKLDLTKGGSLLWEAHTTASTPYGLAQLCTAIAVHPKIETSNLCQITTACSGDQNLEPIASLLAHPGLAKSSLTSLNVGGNGLSDTFIGTLLATVLQLPTITTFCKIPVQSLHTNKLTTLDLMPPKGTAVAAPMSAEGAMVLCKCLETNVSLTFLNVLANGISKQAATRLTEVMKARRVAANQRARRSATEAAPVLATVCGLSPDQTTLDLSNRGLTIGCGVLLNYELRDHSAMVTVNLLGNDFSDANSQRGGMVGWEGDDDFGKNTAAILAKTMAEHATLKSLTGMTEDGVAKPDTELTVGCAVLLAAEVQHCREVLLSDKQLVGEMILQSYNHYDEYAGGPHRDRQLAGWKAICQCLKSSTKLCVLDVSKSNLGDTGAQRHLVALLQQVPTLTSLHCGLCGISERVMALIIAQADTAAQLTELCAVPFRQLQQSSVAELDLQGRMLGTEGGQVLAHFLRGNTAVISLNLASNALGRFELRAGWIRNSQYNDATKHLHFKYKSYGDNEMLQQDQVPRGSRCPLLTSLFAALSQCTALTSVDLSDNEIGEYVMPAGWKYSPQNKHRFLFQKGFHEDPSQIPRQCTPPAGSTQFGFSQLVQAMQSSSTFKQVILRGNFLASAGVRHTADLLDAGCSEIDISNCCAFSETELPPGWEHSHAPRFPDQFLNTEKNRYHKALPASSCSPSVQALVAAIERSEVLSKLVIGGDEQQGDIGSKPAVTLSAAMTKADVCDRNLGAAFSLVLGAFLPKCAQLVELNIAGNNFARGSQKVDVDTEGFVFSLKWLRTLCDAIGDCPALASLTWSGGCVKARAHAEGQNWSPEAVTLTTSATASDLSFKCLGADGALILSAFLPRCQSLVAVALKSAKQRGSLLMRQQGSLVKGAMCYTMSTTDVADPAGLRAIADKMDRSSVTALDLSGNEMTPADSGRFVALGSSSVLIALAMRGCGLGDVGATQFGQRLRSNETLTSLDVRRCDLTAEGCVALIEGARYLFELNVAENDVGMEDCEAVVKALVANPCISAFTVHARPLPIQQLKHSETVDLHCSGLGCLDATIAAALITTNQWLRSFDISGNKIVPRLIMQAGQYSHAAARRSRSPSFDSDSDEELADADAPPDSVRLAADGAIVPVAAHLGGGSVAVWDTRGVEALLAVLTGLTSLHVGECGIPPQLMQTVIHEASSARVTTLCGVPIHQLDQDLVTDLDVTSFQRLGSEGRHVLNRYLESTVVRQLRLKVASVLTLNGQSVAFRTPMWRTESLDLLGETELSPPYDMRTQVVTGKVLLLEMSLTPATLKQAVEQAVKKKAALLLIADNKATDRDSVSFIPRRCRFDGAGAAFPVATISLSAACALRSSPRQVAQVRHDTLEIGTDSTEVRLGDLIGPAALFSAAAFLHNCTKLSKLAFGPAQAPAELDADTTELKLHHAALAPALEAAALAAFCEVRQANVDSNGSNCFALRKLDLFGCRMGTQALLNLAEGLAATCPALANANLLGNLDSIDATDAAAQLMQILPISSNVPSAFFGSSGWSSGGTATSTVLRTRCGLLESMPAVNLRSTGLSDGCAALLLWETSNRNLPQLTNLNLLGNKFTKAQAGVLIEGLHASPALTTLCGLLEAGKGTSLVLSGTGPATHLRMVDCLLLANELQDSQLVNRLDLGNNRLAEDCNGETDMSGLAALVTALVGSGSAVNWFNIAGNAIPTELIGELPSMYGTSVARHANRCWFEPVLGPQHAALGSMFHRVKPPR